MKPRPPASRFVDWIARLGAPATARPRAQSCHWRSPPPVTPGEQPVLEQPLLVFDLETSGLDTQRDDVLALGAVRIEHHAIPLAGHLDTLLRVETALKQDSQLLHGLSQEDLRQGKPAEPALRELLDYGAGCIWLAFHAEFDRRMLERALRRHVRIGFQQTVFDIAALAPMLFPAHHHREADLDYWARIFSIDTPARHSAAGDALLSAELTLVLLREAQRQGLTSWGQLADALLQWRRRQDGNPGPLF